MQYFKMKTRTFLWTTLLAITIFASSQSHHSHNIARKLNLRPHEIEEMMGKPVCIRNYLTKEYLFANKNGQKHEHDNKRRYVFTSPNPPRGKEWFILYNNQGYSLLNAFLWEYLYADNKYDEERRNVFLWRPGGHVQGDEWEIETTPGSVYFKNTNFGEFLFASSLNVSGWNGRRCAGKGVFTWVPKTFVQRGIWEIEPCDYDVFTYE